MERSGSPYRVIADATVPAGDSLVIEPGVVLQFDNATSLIVKGVLRAVGSPEDSVYFQSVNPQPQAGDWNGIFFQDSGTGSLAFAVIEYAATGITCNGTAPDIHNSVLRKNNNGIDFLGDARGTLQYSLIEHNKNAGIRCIGGAPIIRHNLIRNNGHFGFEAAVVIESTSDATIATNLIILNSNAGIDVSNSTGIRIWQNTVAKNDMGIAITDSDADIVNNLVAFNGSGISAENSQPVVRYNLVWGNAGGNFYNMPDSVGLLVQVNANGDSTDQFFNLVADPLFVNASDGDYRTYASSPCVDAGDPANPAGVAILGAAPDIGAFENSGLSLPVELETFYYESGYLHWRTASETNNAGFYVERGPSPEGPFQEIGFVPGQGTTTRPMAYRFAVDPETETYYRLRQVDFDGRVWYSHVIRVAVVPEQLRLAVYPNPYVVRNAGVPLRVSLELPQRERVRLAVYDLLGRQVAILVDDVLSKGRHSFSWYGSNATDRRVAQGVYFYRLETSGRFLRGRFLVIRR
ncbi:MAG: right-handed parallel beta-helix repeat-containing protein [candidate division KSB1 bacterium]|nr:right-handed parallel beta-helix repeat-containing protein [candidate division KSB1 bacterium]